MVLIMTGSGGILTASTSCGINLANVNLGFHLFSYLINSPNALSLMHITSFSFKTRLSLKTALLFAAICFFHVTGQCQYYLRGAVNDESGNGIYNVKILLQSKGTFPFFTGSTGAFGIPITLPSDSITLQADGYETLKTRISAGIYQVFTLKKLHDLAYNSKSRLLSLIQDKHDYTTPEYNSGETYTTLVEHDFTETSSYPTTAIALSINRASYSNIRRFINMEMQVPPDAVRIEEMLNYFSLYDSATNRTGYFTCTSQLTNAPWSKDHQLLVLQLKAPVMELDSLQPANLVFLIDVSGSMDQSNRLPLIKDAFKLLVNNLRPQDTVAIVIYGGYTGTYLAPVSALYKDSIRKAIDLLEPGGDTPGAAAIRIAYGMAERMFSKDANNRIILATDGDFNVGQTSEKDLEDIVLQHRYSGIYLTCLGVGMGNYKDSKLEALAKKGNGNFAYIDNIAEAEKVLVTEFTKTMYAVADDAYMSIKFNPLYVKRYRLIGYDNRKDAEADSIAELEGGEVGTGHIFTIAFEIEPAGYANSAITNSSTLPDIALLNLYYKLPGADFEFNTPFYIPQNFTPFDQIDSNLRFAAAVIMFGGILKQSSLWKNYTWDDVIGIASKVAERNNYVQQEFLVLAGKAKKLYAPPKKRKKQKEEYD